MYHDARRTLVEELGIEPGPELQALYGSILRQERSLVSAPAPSLDDHYDEVMRALCAGRLVPVLGPGAAPIGGTKLLRLLGERFEVDVDGHGLAFVSQAIAARNGSGPSTTSCTAPTPVSWSRPRCTAGWPGCQRCCATGGCRSS